MTYVDSQGFVHFVQSEADVRESRIEENDNVKLVR